MPNGEISLPPRRFVECHRTNGHEILIDVGQIIAAEEIEQKQMRIYCAYGHTFEISEDDYQKVEDVIKEARDYTII